MNKQTVTHTGILAPKFSRYYDAKEADTKQIFIDAILPFLQLPDNWNKYFKFERTTDYIILQENDSYKAKQFKKFKQGNHVVIQQELIDTLKKFIEQTDKMEAQKTQANNSREYFTNLLKTILDSFRNDKFYVHYTDSRGAGVEIQMLEDTMWSKCHKVTDVKILHNGEITQPYFQVYDKYSQSIESAQNWINENKPKHDEIMAKAEEIKASLPTEFFITESATV